MMSALFNSLESWLRSPAAVQYWKALCKFDKSGLNFVDESKLTNTETEVVKKLVK